MSEWKKVEQPPAPLAPGELPPERPVSSPAPAFSDAADSLPEAEHLRPSEPPPTNRHAAPERTARRGSRGPRHAAAYQAPKKKGKHPLAAPIGFLVLILALVGGVSLLVSGWGLIQKAADNAPLKQEITAFLKPVMLQNPAAFKNGKQAASTPSCIKAAIWQVTETERIRMRQKKDDCRYESDDSDRLLIPEKEVTAAFQKLFGKELTPDTGVFAAKGDAFSLWYDKSTGQYHVPAFTASLYQPVVDTVKKKDGVYQVRVGYVAAADIAVDDQGNDIPPTPEDASVFQQYTVQKTGSGYQLTAIADLS